MIKIKFTWILLFIVSLCFIVEGCQPQWEEALATKKARDIMCKDTFVNGWVMHGYMDPYQPEVMNRPESGIPPTLVFFGDGHYLSYDTFNHTTGDWFLNNASDRLALIPTRTNGKDLTPSDNDSLFRYQILFRDSDSLVIGIQGRHGIVEQYYSKKQ